VATIAPADELTISDVAEATGLTNHTLRYYERAGLLSGVERNGSGHRRYSSADVEWVVLVTRLRATGMPIRLIRRYAELVRAGEGNEAERLAILEAHRAEVVAKIDELQHNLELIDYKVGLYRERCGA
jgi:DNA-binding transcriptional MerR regulator